MAEHNDDSRVHPQITDDDDSTNNQHYRDVSQITADNSMMPIMNQTPDKQMKIGNLKKASSRRRSTLATVSFNPDDILAGSIREQKSKNGKVDQSMRSMSFADTQSFDPSFYDRCKTNRHEEYLHAVSQTIPIHELFTVVALKNDNEENQFCTVMLQINQEEFRTELNAKYLLQVWDKRGLKLYQKPLQRRVSAWNNFDEFVLFKYEDDFEETGREETIYLIKVDPNGGTKVVKIHIESQNQLQNFPVLGYFQNYLLVGKENMVRYIDISHILKNPIMMTPKPSYFEEELYFSDFKEFEFQNGSKLLDMLDTTHGYMCIELETDSAELEYLEFRSLSMEGGAKLCDLSDNANRELEGDPIKYYESLRFYSNEDAEYKQCALGYRESGEMDFYWNYRLVESASIEEMNGHKCIGVYSDYDRLYYRLLPVDLDPIKDFDKSTVYSILTIWKEEIGLTSSVPAEFIPKKKAKYAESLEDQLYDEKLGDPYYERVVHSRLSRYAKIYTSFMTYETSVLVAHNKFLSIYNIFTKSWTHHTFEDQIVEVFRNLKPRIDTVFNIAVLVGGHTLRFLEKKDMALTYDPDQTPVDIGGKVMQFAVDQVNDTAFYMVINRDVKKQQMLQELQGSGSFVPAINEVEPDVILSDNRRTITKIGGKLEVVTFMDESFTTLMASGVPRDAEIRVQVSQEFRETILVMDSNAARRQVRFHLRFDKDLVSLGMVETNQYMSQQGTKMESFKVSGSDIDLSENNEYKFVGCIKPGDKYGSRANNLIELNEGHMFINNYKEKAQKCFKDRKIRNFVVDNGWMYTIQDNTSAYQNNMKKDDEVKLIDPKYKGEDTGGQQLPAGLFVYDLNRLILDEHIENYQLLFAIGGVNSHIDLSFETQTIAFIKDYNEIQMIPIPHRNTINFMGIGPKDDYLIWRHSGGTFTAFSKTCKLTIWSVATGKHLTLPKSIGDQETTLLEYQVYQNGDDDISYLTDWQRFDFPTFVDPLKRDNDFSISLICKKADEMEFVNEMRTSVNIQTASYGEIFGPDADVKVTQKKYNHDLYEFKVLKLKEATVEELFNFTKYKFLPDDDGRQPSQKLYFSEDLERMLEVLDDSYAIIYQRSWKTKSTLTVRWTPVIYINRFPSLLAGHTSANFVFSPNFELYWDTDFLNGEFIVRRSKDQSIFCRIEGGLMSLSFKGQDKTKKAIQALGSRLNFISEKYIRVITKDGLDTVMEIPQMKIISFASVPNFIKNDFTHRHAILDRKPIDDNATLERLISKSAIIQVLQNHIDSQVQNKKLSKQQAAISKQRQQNILFETMFSVDYTQNTGNLLKDKFQIDLSFTILDWIILEKIIDVKTFELDNIDKRRQLQLCFNVFPRLVNVFHKFADDATRHKDIERLYELAVEGIEDENGEVQKYYLPFVRDIDGLSPIDYSLREEGGKLNVNTAAVLLNQVKDYPLLHMGTPLTDTVTMAIKHQVPVIGDFCDARLKKADHLSSASMKKKAIMGDRKKIVKGHYYGDSEQDIWCNKRDLEEEPEMLFDPKGYKKLVQLMYFDLIEVNTFSKRGQFFFRMLDEFPGPELFSYRAIQMVITYRWNKMRWYIFIMQFTPYLIMLIVYSYWANFLQVEEAAIQKYGSKEALIRANNIFCLILMLFSIYFIIFEINVMLLKGWSYWMQPWKYVDIIPITMILILQCLSIQDYSHNQETYFVRLMSFSSLIMWLKFLYYLRIWKTTGYLVRMLTEVINEMKIFLLVLGVIVIAFTDAFFSLANAQVCLDEDCTQRFLETYDQALVYSYLLILGEFGEYQDIYQGENQYVLTILLVTCTLLNLVVMLNLLISIISGTYEKVSLTQEEYSYKAKLSVITEVQISRWFSTANFNMMNKFLLYAIESLPILKEENEITIENVNGEVLEVKKQLAQVMEIVEKINGRMEEDEEQEEIKKQKSEASFLGDIFGVSGPTKTQIKANANHLPEIANSKVLSDMSSTTKLILDSGMAPIQERQSRQSSKVNMNSKIKKSAQDLNRIIQSPELQDKARYKS